MTAKAKKAGRPLLTALHDTAMDLHKAGFMDLESLREYDALCLDDEVFEAKDIVELRSQLQISQGVLAAFVNTTTSTMAQWEAGDKRPGGPARRVLWLLKRNGLEALAEGHDDSTDRDL